MEGFKVYFDLEEDEAVKQFRKWNFPLPQRTGDSVRQKGALGLTLDSFVPCFNFLKAEAKKWAAIRDELLQDIKKGEPVGLRWQHDPSKAG